MEDLLTSSYKPAHQLVVYESGDKSYIEHYEIIEREGKAFLTEGKPLTKSTLKKILDLVLTSDKSAFATVKKLLPENVLYCDARPGKVKLIWYTPAQEYSLTGIYSKTVKVKLPAFIYRVEYDTFYIYATRTGKNRPQLNTPLFHPALPNVYGDCKVCMGNVKKPSSSIEIADLINGWHKAFWGSEFNSYLHDDKQEAILKKAIKTKTPFPVRSLKPIRKQLKNIF